jgi:hypothetical protein
MAGSFFIAQWRSGRLLVLILFISFLLNARLATLYHFQEHNIDRNQTSSSPLLSSLHQSTLSLTSKRTKKVSQPRRSKELIPAKPDPQLWENLQLTWKHENGTEITELREDAHLKRIRDGSCPPTAQFRLEYNSNNNTDWILISLDRSGARKSIGGDEMYVVYHHRNLTKISPTAVAYSLDQGDGSYRLQFHSTPFTRQNITQRLEEGGQLVIYMQYTCGLGTLHHPEKLYWRTGGSLMRTYKQYVPYPPIIQKFVPPNSDGAIDLEKYRKVVIFGDSNLHGHYMAGRATLPNLHFVRKPDSPLTWRSMNQKFLPKIAWFLNLTMFEDPNPLEHRYALMIGSACWDIVFPENSGPNFKEHLRALRYMLVELKKIFDPMGNVDIYWHSGFSLHLHIAGEEEAWEDRKPIKYMSYSRSEYLYRRQMQLLEEVGNVRLLDFMEATYLSGDHYMRGDARHAQAGLARKLFYYYYPQRKEPQQPDTFRISRLETSKVNQTNR